MSDNNVGTDVREITVEQALENILDRLGGLEEAISALSDSSEELRERQEALITAVGELDRGDIGYSIES